MTEITPLNTLARYLQRLTETRLWAKVLLAIALGAAAGALLNPGNGLVAEGLSRAIGDWLALPGKLFLKLVQMIMIPLIFTSIISGIVSNTNGQLRLLGPRLLVYFVATTAVSIAIGTVLALFLRPGAYIRERQVFELPPGSAQGVPQRPGFSDIPGAISDLVPDNPFASIVSGEMLSIVIFTIIIGIAVTQLKEATINPISRLMHAVQEICMTVVSWAMLLVPYAVFGLIAQLTSSIGVDGLVGIGYFAGTVLLGLALLLVFYMLVVALLGRRSPFTFLRKVREVQLLAFSTSSSAAVMPLSMKTADEELGVSGQVSDLVIPIGATINMDGTALFQCVAALFIAQAYGVELALSSVLLMTVTIVAASIGTPAIPGGGVIVLASVLQSVGIPTEGLVIIIGVDRILGMFRTAVNVTGDLTASVVFDRWMRSSVQETQRLPGGMKGYPAHR